MNARQGAPWLLVAALLLAACASSASTRERRNTDVITRAEVEALDVSTGYEVVQRLKPQWLRIPAPRSHARPTEVIVIVDELQIGGVEALRDILASNIISIRWLDSAQAGRLPNLGSRHIEGAIVVETR